MCQISQQPKCSVSSIIFTLAAVGVRKNSYCRTTFMWWNTCVTEEDLYFSFSPYSFNVSKRRFWMFRFRACLFGLREWWMTLQGGDSRCPLAVLMPAEARWDYISSAKSVDAASPPLPHHYRQVRSTYVSKVISSVKDIFFCFFHPLNLLSSAPPPLVRTDMVVGAAKQLRKSGSEIPIPPDFYWSLRLVSAPSHNLPVSSRLYQSPAIL